MLLRIMGSVPFMLCWGRLASEMPVKGITLHCDLDIIVLLLYLFYRIKCVCFLLCLLLLSPNFTNNDKELFSCGAAQAVGRDHVCLG